MRSYMIKAPTWAMILIFGVPFGAVMSVFIKVSGETTMFTLCAGGISALLFGTSITLATNGQRREQRLILEAIPQSDWKAARGAAWKGAVPDRPEIRAAAAQLADRQFDRLRRYQKLVVIVFGLNLAIAVFNSVAGSRWHILLVLGWMSALIGHWDQVRRLRRRVELLTDQGALQQPDA